MKVLDTVEQGYLRGDSAAAKYLGMDRKTFARLVRGKGGPRPAIKGGSRYWKVAALDEWMAPVQGTAYTVRPNLAARNRARAARATTGINSAESNKLPEQQATGINSEQESTTHE